MFYKKWKFYAPASLKTLIDKGVDDYDAEGQIVLVVMNNDFLGKNGDTDVETDRF